jgi:hypothetical protein
MAQGNEIIVSAEPRGQFLEGIVYGTPYPGTVMQVRAATEPQALKYQWEPYNAAADGNQRLIAVLLPDSLQGKLATTAYTTGSRCFLYCPLPGELLNMLYTDTDTGTSDTFAIGDIMMVDDGTGRLVATLSTPESEPFVCMETWSDTTAAAANVLLLSMFTGY